MEKVRAPCKGENHAERGIGNLFGSVIRDVADRNPVGTGGDVVDVVITYPTPDDDPAVRETFKGLPGNGEVMVADEGGGILDLSDQFFLAHGVERHQLGFLPKDAPLNGEGFGDEVRDDDFWSAHG